MAVPRDSQFMAWAKLLSEEIYDDFRGLNLDYDDGNDQGVEERRKEIEKAIAQRTHDLAWFIVRQVYRGESKPGEMLCIDGEPVKIQPENLAEWFKKAPFLASYDGLPNEIKAWVEQDLGWKRDEVTGVGVENHSALKDAPCVLISVTVERGQEAKSQEFIRGDNGWKVAYEVTG